jgi:hypothetical protein
MSKAALVQEFKRQAGAVGVVSHVGLVLDFGTGGFAADNMTKANSVLLDTALGGGIRAPAGSRQT